MDPTTNQPKALTRQLVVRVADRLFGLDIDIVREMLELPELTPMPRVGERMRGVMNLRGRVVPVVDLRITLGMPPLGDEIERTCEVLHQRQADHKNWLDELDASIAEGRRFTGQTDPTKCKFGVWYANFESPNRQIAAFMERFDKPHRRIHSIATATSELVASGQVDEALEMITSVRSSDLSALNQLFEQLRDMIQSSRREVAVLLSDGGQSFAASVDEVVAVETLELVHDAHDALESKGMSGMARGIATRADGSLVLLLEIGTVAAGLNEVVEA
ncbi:MAG: chemotaxis protein CheW [Planctomycetes bacterium]|nr:chemotaxis protein CheW [Planctomycetota bacterium]